MSATATALGRPDILVRAAADADMARIQAIYAHHVTTGLGSFEEMAPPLGEMLRRRAEILARDLPYIVAEAGGQILGYAYAGPFRPRTAYRFSVEDSIYVAPEAMRRGVGGLLLGELIQRCSAIGMRQMLAVIGDSANLASIRVHAAHGFVDAGRLLAVGFKFGRWVDSVIMQRALGPGSTTLP